MNKDERSSQNVARKFLITNSKQLEQNKNAKFYKKNYGVNKKDFREVHQQNLTEMKELRKFQSSTFDTLTRQKFTEDHNTIMELSVVLDLVEQFNDGVSIEVRTVLW